MATISWAGGRSEHPVPAGARIVPLVGEDPPARLYALPMLRDAHCHLPPDGCARPDASLRPRRDSAASRLTQEGMVRSADDMGLGWLDEWPSKPSWVRSALRGITGPRAPRAFEAFAVPAEDPDAAGALAEGAIRSGATLVKLIATGSAIGTREEAVTPLLAASAIAAVGQVARRHQVPLVVHCHGGPILDAVLDAGASRIEHGIYLTGSDLASIRDAGASVVVTPGAYLDHGGSEARQGLGSLVGSLLAQQMPFALGTDGHDQTMLGQVRAIVALGVPFERAVEAALEPGASIDDTSLGHGDLILFDMDPAKYPEALDHPVARLLRGSASTSGAPAA